MGDPSSPWVRRRPRAVTWLALGVLILSGLYWARLALSLSLPALPLSVPDWYLPLTGGLWGGVGLLVGAALWAGRPRAPRLAAWAGALYLAWFWIDRLALVRTDYAQRTAPTAALLTLAAAAVYFGTLRRRSVRRYFGETTDE